MTNFLAQLREILSTLQAIRAELEMIRDLLEQLQFPTPLPGFRLGVSPAQPKE